MRRRLVRALPARPLLLCRDGPVVGYDVARPLLEVEESMRPTLAVWKFASPDGCQLTVLDCEDELLTLAEQVKIATFAGGLQHEPRRARTTSRWWRFHHDPGRRAAHP